MDVGTWRPGHRLSKSVVELPYTQAGGDALTIDGILNFSLIANSKYLHLIKKMSKTFT